MMSKALLSLALAAGLGLTACTNPYDPGQRAAGGALIGAGTGAAIGGIAGGGRGAAIGALAGGAVGAATGAATTPVAPQPYYGSPYGGPYGGGYERPYGYGTPAYYPPACGPYGC